MPAEAVDVSRCPSPPIVQAAAGNLKKVSPELGGKSPNIVFDDADTGAVEGAANAIFFNHGQCSVAGSRLFVQEDRFNEVVNGVAEIAKGIKLGPGMESGTQMGPLVSGEQLRRVTGFLECGVADGATTVTGGGRFGDRAPRFTSTRPAGVDTGWKEWGINHWHVPPCSQPSPVR